MSETQEVGGWRIALLFFIALLATYSALVLVPFAATDDYLNLAMNKRGLVWSLPSLGSGRPLLAVLVAAGFSAVQRIADLRYLRLLGVLGVSLIAYQLYVCMLRAGWKRGVAAAGAYLVCVTPPFQCLASWAVCFSTLSGAAMSIAGHRFAVVAFDEPASPARWGRTAAAVALVAAAGMIYQPVMVIYVVPLAIDWFRLDRPPPRPLARLIWCGAVLGAGIAVELVAYEVGLSRFGNFVDPARAGLAVHAGDKLEWFVTGPLLDALNLWRLWSTPELAVLVGAALIVGLLVFFRGGVVRRLASLGVALGLVPIAYLANLAAGESWGAYRTQIALTSLIVIYALLALQGLLRARAQRPLACLLAVGALAAGLLAAYHVQHYYVDPQMLELHVMRKKLRAIDLAKVRKLWLIPSSWEDVADDIRYDEFGVPSTSRPWSAEPMVWLVLRDMTDSPPKFPIEQAPAEATLKPAAHEAVLDMSDLAAYR